MDRHSGTLSTVVTPLRIKALKKHEDEVENRRCVIRTSTKLVSVRTIGNDDFCFLHDWGSDNIVISTGKPNFTYKFARGGKGPKN
jgi:hypothetical protein